MTRRTIGRILACVLAFSAPAVARAFDERRAACVLEAAALKLLAADARLTPGDTPKATVDGRWSTVPASDAVGWTQGFFPGSLWLVYGATGADKWRARAEAWTAPLAVQRTNTASHDLGFKLVPSFGGQLARTGDPAARQVLLDAAVSLASRYDGRVGAVKCCDWNPDWRFPVVIDTMVNLELLLWSAANGGPASHRDMAIQHALTTARDLVRADGGTYHVADYEPSTGALRSRGTFQGAGDETTWSRGEAWALYGFTTAWRYTGDARMLAAARKVAAYWLARTPSSGVTPWDFDTPGAQQDTSAAAAAASALLALAEVGGSEGDAYRARALATLDTLATADVDGGAGEALLLHGVGDLPHGQEIDVGLVYGDYYFLEATLRAFPRPSVSCSTAPTPTPTPTATATPTPTPTPTPVPSPAGPQPAASPGSKGGGCGLPAAGLAALVPALIALRRTARRARPRGG